MMSWVIPYRDRPDALKKMIQSVWKHWTNFEMCIVEQGDDRPFLRGQLCNIGVQHTTGETVLLQDVDVVHEACMDFDAVLKKCGRPYVPFDGTVDIEMDANGRIVKRWPKRLRLQGWGGLTVFTREMFLNACGFSNLMIGWGGEDNILQMRAGIIRIVGDLLHLQHPSLAGNGKDPARIRNKALIKSDLTRDHKKDGVNQTVYVVNNEKVLNEACPRIWIVTVRNITVPIDFVYMNLLPEWYKPRSTK